MLHWLRSRSGRNRQLFWLKLLAVSFAGHSVLLIIIFFLYKDDLCQYNMTVNSKNLRRGAPIIFMPFHKVVNAHRMTGQLATSVGAVKTTTVGLVAHETTHKKAATSLVDEKERKKIEQQQVRAKKLKEKKLKEKRDKALREKEEKKRKRLEKKEQEEKLKKEQQKKKEKKQQEEEKKQQEEEKKPVEEIKKEEPIKQEAPVVPVQQEPVVVQPAGTQDAGAGPFSDMPQDAVYMGQIEMEELNRQEELQQQITQYWKPPVGLREGLECTLKFTVDADGNATNVIVDKSSGVLVYDMSARMAVSQMHMPPWARGKELSITFI